MTALNSETLIEGHLQLLAGLSDRDKNLLIRKLQSSDDTEVLGNALQAAFGAWVGDESAEEIIAAVRGARTANPIRELL